MKSIKSPQRVIIIFLTLFIVVCCFLIVRLEIKAANLQSQWDKHQKSLNENMDVLNDLKSFARNVKSGCQIKLSNNLIMHGGGSNFLLLEKDGSISYESMMSSDRYFGYDSQNKKTYMKGPGNGIVSIGNKNEKNSLLIKDDIIAITSWGQNKNVSGIEISSKVGTVELYNGNDKSAIRLDNENIRIQGNGDIILEGKTSADKYFEYDANWKRTVISTGEMGEIQIESSNGKNVVHLSDTGVKFYSKENGIPVGIDITASAKNIQLYFDDSTIRLEKDNIDFETSGDINITSTNGNVNIKGKKVKVNE